MPLRSPSRHGLAALTLLATPVFLAALPPRLHARTWTDSTGQHKVEAELVKVEGGNVTLKRTDGKTVVLPLQRLSEADRTHLEQTQEQSAWKIGDPLYIKVRGDWQLAELTEVTDGPGAARYRVTLKSGDRRTLRVTDKRMRRYGKAGEHDVLLPGDVVEYKSGFKWVTAELVSHDGRWAKIKLEGALAPKSTPLSYLRAPGSGRADASVGKTRVASRDATAEQQPDEPTEPEIEFPEPPPLKKVDFAGVRVAAATGAAPTALSARSGPAAETAPAKLRPLPLALTPKRSSWDKAVDLSVAADGSRAAVLRGSWSNDEQTVELIDLTSQSKPLLVGLPPETTRLYLSPDGTRLLTSRTDPFALDLWDIDPQGISHVVSWNPKQKPDDYWETLLRVRWVDQQNVLTATKAGAVLWDATEATPRYKTAGSGAAQVFDRGRRLAQLQPDTGGIAIFDADTGELQALIGKGAHLDGSLIVSPAGRLAMITQRTGLVELWDLTGGKKVIRTVRPDETNAAPAWTSSEGLVRFGGQTYAAPMLAPAEDSSPGSTADRRAEVLARRGSAGMTDQAAGHTWGVDGFTLQASVLPPPQEAPPVDLTLTGPFALAPGGAVAVEVNVASGLGGPVRDRIVDAVRQQGFTVAEGSRVKLLAATSQGESQTQTYRTIFGGAGDNRETTVSYTPRLYTVKLMVDGQTRWESTNRVSAPTSFRNEGGKSINQMVQEHLQWAAHHMPTPQMPEHIYAP